MSTILVQRAGDVSILQATGPYNISIEMVGREFDVHFSNGPGVFADYSEKDKKKARLIVDAMRALFLAVDS